MNDALLRGDGIDMYDLVPNLYENDEYLISTGKKFWVGVIEGMYPSPPVPRRRTKCYSSADVYLYLDTKVFSMLQKNDEGQFYKSFYKIPERELIFTQ